MSRGEIFIFGASGHAKVVIDIIEKQNTYKIEGICDDNPALKGILFMGYPVVGGKTDLLEKNLGSMGGIVAIGANDTRCMLADWLKHEDYNLVTIVHPSVQIAKGASICEGTVVMANAVINSFSRIGQNVIVNTGVIIDHDCFIEDGVHIAPGATLCGAVHVGQRTFLGAGVTVIQNISIGSDVFIGAGTTVYRDVADGSRIVGPRYT